MGGLTDIPTTIYKSSVTFSLTQIWFKIHGRHSLGYRWKAETHLLDATPLGDTKVPEWVSIPPEDRGSCNVILNCVSTSLIKFESRLTNIKIKKTVNKIKVQI